MSALIVVVLSAVYTKRAIDRRLASVHVEEEVVVDEQHFLLGASSSSHDDEETALTASGAGAPAGEHGSRHGVMISVETPMLVVRRSSSEPGSKQQQPLRTLGDSSGANQLGWGARVASRFGLGAGSSSSTRKLKVTDDFDTDAPTVPQQPTEFGDPVGSSSHSSKACCKNRNGH